jgi:23S rRNA pseudouridine1911/1915/1917 synthase
MTETISLNIRIPQSLSGMRLDKALAELFPDYSRALLTKWIKNNEVSLDGCHKKPDDRVKGFELVQINATLSQPQQLLGQNIALNIIHEDTDLLIINKAAGLVVHPATGNPDSTLANALVNHKQSLKLLPRAGLIHRLDKDTTGLIIVAKNINYYHHLVTLMQKRSIKRNYYALVHGTIKQDTTIETFMGRHPKNRLKMAVTKTGKNAITHVKVKKTYPHFTLLNIALETGRTHQIRVHLQHINHPIVGDRLYCGKNKVPNQLNEPLKDAFNNFKRQALHAYQLSLTHHDKTLTVTAPLPQDFNHLLQLLDNNYE